MLLFYVLVFWPHGMWDLSSLARDWTLTPCTGRQSLNGWTTREAPQPEDFFLCYCGNFQTFTVNKIDDVPHLIITNCPTIIHICDVVSPLPLPLLTPSRMMFTIVSIDFKKFTWIFFLSTRSCLLRGSSVLKFTRRTRTTRTPSAPLLTISSQEWKQVGISSILSGQRKWLPGYMLY